MPKKDYPDYGVDIASLFVLPRGEKATSNNMHKLATVKWFHGYSQRESRNARKAAFDLAKSLTGGFSARVFVSTQYQRNGKTNFKFEEVTK